MRRSAGRRATPKVVDGRVRRKNRHATTPGIWASTEVTIEQDRPGRGHFHLLSAKDLRVFFGLNPDWEALSQGLQGVRLAAKRPGMDGFCTYSAQGSVISLCAWERGLHRLVTAEFLEDHRALLHRLGVPHRRQGALRRLEFTAETARAYQLLHVLLHELGHHQDRMTSRRRASAGRGEGHAEAWALAREAELRAPYEAAFGLLPPPPPH